MLKLILVACLLALTYTSSSGHKSHSKIRGRIVNGTNAEEGEFPFAAVLRHSPDNTELCGASILNKNYVLTAAQCVDCAFIAPESEPSEFNVQYGLIKITKDDTNSVGIKTIHCNNYTEIRGSDDDYFENLYDTAILELATPLPDDGSWEPVTLSRVFDSTDQQEGVIIGWGDDSNGQTTVLQKVAVDIYDDTVCGAATRGHYDHHVCIGSIGGRGGTGPCIGDAGAAALVDGVQVGSASYTTSEPPKCGDATKAYPEVYARIEKYFDWIKKITPDIKTIN